MFKEEEQNIMNEEGLIHNTINYMKTGTEYFEQKSSIMAEESIQAEEEDI